MTERSITHATFTIERTYAAPAARVFAAWADPATKRRWFGGPDEGETNLQLDFRIDGRETQSGKGPDGGTYSYAARYQDIVPDERIVYTYEMHLNDTRISVSLGSVELKPEKQGGTRLIYTEQGAFLDGLDKPADREHGTRELFDQLAVVVEEGAAASTSRG